MCSSDLLKDLPVPCFLSRDADKARLFERNYLPGIGHIAFDVGMGTGRAGPAAGAFPATRSGDRTGQLNRATVSGDFFRRVIPASVSGTAECDPYTSRTRRDHPGDPPTQYPVDLRPAMV